MKRKVPEGFKFNYEVLAAIRSAACDAGYGCPGECVSCIFGSGYEIEEFKVWLREELGK